MTITHQAKAVEYLKIAERWGFKPEIQQRVGVLVIIWGLFETKLELAVWRLRDEEVPGRHASRKIFYFNVTAHPTADWTLQELREAIPANHPYEFLIRDRDAKFASRLDECVRRLRLQVLKTPVRTIGTICRECLDYLISLGERHLRKDPGGMDRALQHSAAA